MAAIESICDKLQSFTTNHRPAIPSPNTAESCNMATMDFNMVVKPNRRKMAKPKSLRMQEEEYISTKCDLTEFETNNPDVDFSNYADKAIDENSNKIEESEKEERKESDHENSSSIETYSDHGFVNTAETDSLSLDDVDDDDVLSDGGHYDDDDDYDYDVSSAATMTTAADCYESRFHSDSRHGYLDADDFPDDNDTAEQENSDVDEAVDVLPNYSVPMDLSVKKESNSIPNRPSNATASSSTCLSKKHGGQPSYAADLKNYAENTMNELLSMYGLNESRRSKPVNFTDDVTSIRTSCLPPKKAFMAMAAQACHAVSHVSSHAASHAASEHSQNDTSQKRPKCSVIGSPPALIPLSRLNSCATPPPGVYATPSQVTAATGVQPDSSTFGKARLLPEHPTTRVACSNAETPSGLQPDYAKYIQRYETWEECQSCMCRDMLYREHYHCMDCNFRVFVKREEMIRHYKWHKKRDDSLQHGFLRFSPMDDCSESFESCAHNRKQTHYHCLQRGCDKVYVSTSDVQMHSNYHRKATAIIQEGFQRFRATEDCGTMKCQFYGQRTTHFHCRRPLCSFTFKNKADMEKHKTYHQKDEVLSKDGFKKFMKYEHCTYNHCKYSKQSNHIHCIRPDCKYVLHSTGQLYSHKRKHERREFEFQYKRPARDDDSNSTDSHRLSQFDSPVVRSQPTMTSSGFMYETNQSSRSVSPRDSPQQIRSVQHYANLDLSTSLNLPFTTFGQATNQKPCNNTVSTNQISCNNASTNHQPCDTNDDDDKPIIDECQPRNLPPIMEKPERDESWKKYLTRYTANDPCRARCVLLYKDHYHCNMKNCNVLFRTKERVREHGRLHDQEDRITFLAYRTVSNGDQCYIDGCTADGTMHYHCLWPECNHVIETNAAALSRIQHFRQHEQQRHRLNLGRQWRFTQEQLAAGGLMKRKRGRPPKFPKDNIPVVPKVEIPETEMTPDLKFTREQFLSSLHGVVNGFKLFQTGEPCPDSYCSLHLREHFHCVRPRCHHVSHTVDLLHQHGHEFHNYVTIMDGFEFFDRGINCRRPNCQNNRTNKHFHCVRPRCDYAFVRHNTMYQHDKKHHQSEESAENEAANQSRDSSSASQPAANQSEDASKPKTVVKASGTFYPLSTLPKSILPKSGTSLLPVCGAGSVDAKPIASVVPTLATSGASIASHFFFTGMPPLLSLPGLIPMVTAPFQLQSSAGNVNFTSPITTTSSAITLQQANAAVTALNSAKTFVTSTSQNSTATDSQPKTPTTLSAETKQEAEVLDNWTTIRSKMHYELNQNCGRPFCKLKKRDHYHCFDCNQAFSDPERLRAHVGRHGVKFERMKNDGSPRKSTDNESLDLSLNLNGEIFTAKMAAGRERSTDNVDEEESEESFGRLEIDLDKSISEDSMNSSMERRELDGLKRRSTADVCDDALAVKHRRIVTPRISKDEPIPDGYLRYWAHEDCGRRGCSYRQSTTHYHCRRDTCGFGICSRPRIDQHSLRHQRIDRIMGQEFVQYRANVACHTNQCYYSEKATHFHCKKCSFICTDTIKVTAHRKHHNKNDFFVSQGFEKFTQSTDCRINDCKYSLHQTHYHCLYTGCFAAVLGQAQMSPHRLKHAGLAGLSNQLMTSSDRFFTKSMETRNTLHRLYGGDSLSDYSTASNDRDDYFADMTQDSPLLSNIHGPSNGVFPSNGTLPLLSSNHNTSV